MLKRVFELFHDGGAKAVYRGIRDFAWFHVLRPLYRNTLRRVLPSKFAVYSGVPVKNSRLLDFPDESTLESTQVSVLRRAVRPGDDVVVIGGGFGVTAATAATRVAPDGTVTVFEADADMAEWVRDTVQRSRLDGFVEVNHQPVGEIGDVEALMGISVDAGDSALLPEDIPRCDVLEIDCEGGEASILTEIEITPRVLIVEIHEKTGYAREDAVDDLNEVGYEVVAWGSDGDHTPIAIAEPRDRNVDSLDRGFEDATPGVAVAETGVQNDQEALGYR